MSLFFCFKRLSRNLLMCVENCIMNNFFKGHNFVKLSFHQKITASLANSKSNVLDFIFLSTYTILSPLMQFSTHISSTPPVDIMCRKWEGDCGLWVLNEMIKKQILKVWKKSWEPFGSCLKLSNGSHNFFQTFSIYVYGHFIKNPQTTIALPFLTHNISAIGGVYSIIHCC